MIYKVTVLNEHLFIFLTPLITYLSGVSNGNFIGAFAFYDINEIPLEYSEINSIG